MKNKRNRKGSILAFTLIMLSILLLAGISLSGVVLTDRKMAINSGKSLQALQTTESGIANVVDIIKRKEQTNNLEDTIGNTVEDWGGTCSNGVIEGLIPDSQIYFRNEAGNDTLDCSDPLHKIGSIRSYGKEAQSARAVEVNIRKYVFFCGYHKIKDSDETIYYTQKIGDQCWMKQNLTVGEQIDGNELPNGSEIEKYCPDDEEDKCTQYGALYSFGEAKEACPSGWHLPTDGEWTILEKKMGNCGASRDDGWDCAPAGKEFINENNEPRQLIFPLSGKRNTNTPPRFESPGFDGYYWTANDSGNTATYRQIQAIREDVNKASMNKSSGLSVRCIKN
ncbi:MAG: hypothetical protein IPN70_04310 [Candidatus Moraniibacteriota bacterium]|nr:MAG: hypothetical protein IPN70_04310 [Candidatus Moranbacteria bacterium]